MSEKLGPLNFGKEGTDPFLGRDYGRTSNYSEKIAEEIDAEVHKIVTHAYSTALGILKDKKDIIRKTNSGADC